MQKNNQASLETAWLHVLILFDLFPEHIVMVIIPHICKHLFDACAGLKGAPS